MSLCVCVLSSHMDTFGELGFTCFHYHCLIYLNLQLTFFQDVQRLVGSEFTTFSKNLFMIKVMLIQRNACLVEVSECSHFVL